MNRRQLISAGAASAAALAFGGRAFPAAADETTKPTERAMPRYCLNTSTIRGQKLPLVEEVDLAAKAGYDGIEPWIGEINQYVAGGGSLNDLSRRIADAGLKVESAIGFAKWIVDDDDERKAALESAKRDMDLVRQIGGKRIAAPPVGATDKQVEPAAAAERYAKLLEVGRGVGVTPMLELWGFSKTLQRVSEVAAVVKQCGQKDAEMLFDVYHVYKGGSDFKELRKVDCAAIGAFHFNDYPADPPRERISDADRVYCGDGVAPLAQIVRDIYAGGYHGPLSLELFNRGYWKQDAEQVARTGLEKLRRSVEQALA